MQIVDFKPVFSKHITEQELRKGTVEVAKLLIGSYMIRTVKETSIVCRIVETEAYLGTNDAACHAATKRTPRNDKMFEHGGILYVYSIYGIHHCINVVTEDDSVGCAVLIRAAEPLHGIDFIQEQRGDFPTVKLLSGPGNVAKGLGFTRNENGISCCNTELWLQHKDKPVSIAVSTRIGITKSAQLPLRFFDIHSKSVSAHKRYTEVVCE